MYKSFNIINNKLDNNVTRQRPTILQLCESFKAVIDEILVSNLFKMKQVF